MSRVSEVEIDKAVDSIRHMSLDELKIISDEISMRRTSLSRENMRTINVGDRVSFTGRNGGEQTGEVTKKAIKYVTVDTGFGRWKVPASMLTLV
jgi:hypothetical protein